MSAAPVVGEQPVFNNQLCNLTHGYRYKQDCDEMFGHILTLEYDGVEMPANTNVHNPEDPDGPMIPVVGVFEFIHWLGKAADHLRGIFHTSELTRSKLNTGAANPKANHRWKMSFKIWQPNNTPGSEGKPFVYLASDDDGAGPVEIDLAGDSADPNASPLTIGQKIKDGQGSTRYPITFEVRGAEDGDQQQLVLQTEPDNKIMKKIGIPTNIS